MDESSSSSKSGAVDKASGSTKKAPAKGAAKEEKSAPEKVDSDLKVLDEAGLGGVAKKDIVALADAAQAEQDAQEDYLVAVQEMADAGFTEEISADDLAALAKAYDEALAALADAGFTEGTSADDIEALAKAADDQQAKDDEEAAKASDSSLEAQIASGVVTLAAEDPDEAAVEEPEDDRPAVPRQPQERQPDPTAMVDSRFHTENDSTLPNLEAQVAGDGLFVTSDDDGRAVPPPAAATIGARGRQVVRHDSVRTKTPRTDEDVAKALEAQTGATGVADRLAPQNANLGEAARARAAADRQEAQRSAAQEIPEEGVETAEPSTSTPAPQGKRVPLSARSRPWLRDRAQSLGLTVDLGMGKEVLVDMIRAKETGHPDQVRLAERMESGAAGDVIRSSPTTDAAAQVPPTQADTGDQGSAAPESK